jgi:hypothetical protein
MKASFGPAFPDGLPEKRAHGGSAETCAGHGPWQVLAARLERLAATRTDPVITRKHRAELFRVRFL